MIFQYGWKQQSEHEKLKTKLMETPSNALLWANVVGNDQINGQVK